MVLNNDELLRIQEKEIQIFKSFMHACQRLNLKYYLIGGTLLGAVRHGGFIPWDDDIDIGMPREDYEVFIAKGQDLLPENIFIQNYKTDPQFPQAFTKLRNTDTAFIESSVAHLDINHGIFIDVFPIDKKIENRFFLPFWRIKERIINYRISYLFNRKYNVFVRAFRPLTKMFYRTASSAVRAKDMLYRSGKSDTMVANYSGYWGKKEIVPASWAEDTQKIDFEGLVAPIPREYDKWLTQLYGDYMQPPPEEKRVTHHFTNVIDTDKPYAEYNWKGEAER